MKCPECGGKAHVEDVVHTPDNEVYRRKVCSSCGRVFFSVEYEVEPDKRLADIWLKYRGRKVR